MASESLLNTPVEEVIPSGQVPIIIDGTKTVPEAFRILSSNNIYSAPVVNPSNGEYYGFVDMLDVVTFIINIFEEKKGDIQKQSSSPFQSFMQILEHVEAFDSENISKLVDISRHNPMCPLPAGSPLKDALDIFSRVHTHRIPIMGSDNKIKNILTQSAIINWLAKHKKSINANLASKTIKEWNLGYKDVISVSVEDRAYDAFKLMAKNRITAVAILDTDGTLFTNLSAKDIQLVANQALFSFLFRTSLEFVQTIRSRDLKAVIPVISCKEDETIVHMIERLAATRIHRLYVVDASRKPIGVITLGDLLKKMIEFH